MHEQNSINENSILLFHFHASCFFFAVKSWDKTVDRLFPRKLSRVAAFVVVVVVVVAVAVVVIVVVVVVVNPFLEAINISTSTKYVFLPFVFPKRSSDASVTSVTPKPGSFRSKPAKFFCFLDGKNKNLLLVTNSYQKLWTFTKKYQLQLIDT